MFQKVLDYPKFMMGILDHVSQCDLQQENDESTQRNSISTQDASMAKGLQLRAYIRYFDSYLDIKQSSR